ncbi:MAG: peptidylprolyl isomerase, partial [Dolichospermum sp.]
MPLKFPQFFVAWLIIFALTLGGCTSSIESSNTSPTSAATTSTQTVSKPTNESIPGMKDLPRLEGKATVVMTVNGAPITMELDGTNAPITAGNFVDL